MSGKAGEIFLDIHFIQQMKTYSSCYSLNRSNFSRFGSRDKIVIQLKTQNKKSRFTSETGHKKQKKTPSKNMPPAARGSKKAPLRTPTFRPLYEVQGLPGASFEKHGQSSHQTSLGIARLPHSTKIDFFSKKNFAIFFFFNIF